MSATILSFAEGEVVGEYQLGGKVRLVEGSVVAGPHDGVTVVVDDVTDLHSDVVTDDFLGEIYATLAAQGAAPDGHGGGVYANELFNDEHGDATVFVPCRARFRTPGRVEAVIVPAVELAVTTHCGHHSEPDRTYGALAAHVAEHAIAVDGPLREYYLVSSRDTPDTTLWRTEIGWPIFHIGITTPPDTTSGPAAGEHEP